MTAYLVWLNGQNFLIDEYEGPRKRQFHSTRLVEAENQNRAESLARELICNDPHLQNSVLNEDSGPPIIDLESVIEVSAMAYDAQNCAHSFYWEDEDTEE
jgi:Ser/Thr protein kinase RdoA (MazF antagonist)